MKTPGKVSLEERIEGIFELHRSIISIFFKSFEDKFPLPEGMNFTHMKALMMLRFHSHMTMSELSDRLALEKGSFTPVAAKLIDMGYVRKVRSREDKRVYNLDLTESGMTLTTRLRDAHGVFIQTSLDRLDGEEKADYFRFIEELNRLNDKIREGGE